jgi:malate synthase
VQAGGVELLWAVVHDPAVPLLARSRAAQVFHVLACSAEGLAVTTIQRVAQMLVYLMAPEQPVELIAMGVKGAAILALEHKGDLARSHGIRRLVMHMNDAATEEIQVGSLKALLNLSLSLKNQERICRRALPALLRLNNDPDASRDVRTFTSGLLHNLSKNPANTTAFYKAELWMRMGNDPSALPAAAASNPNLNPAPSWEVRRPACACEAPF